MNSPASAPLSAGIPRTDIDTAFGERFLRFVKRHTARGDALDSLDVETLVGNDPRDLGNLSGRDLSSGELSRYSGFLPCIRTQLL